MQLRQLQRESRCVHFVQLIDWVKAKPPLLYGGFCEPDDVFLYYKLEYATTDLYSLRRTIVKRLQKPRVDNNVGR